MRRYLLHLSYFGNRYRGFQKQNFKGDVEYHDPHTVCGLLEIALKGCEPANHPIVVPSSRTDKGVHAICNTAHVDLDDEEYKISAHSIATTVNNFFLYNDHDIRVLKVQQVADDFHSRFKAIERRYLYRFAVPKHSVPFRERLAIPSPVTEVNRCLFLQDPTFDLEAVKSACNIFIGNKDFAALSSKKGNRIPKEIITERSINDFQLVQTTPFLPLPYLSEGYDFYHFICSGKSFLYHQVRRMVSALLIYGQGKVSLADVQRLIDEPVESSWKPFRILAVPYGLYLLEVRYNPEDLHFSERLEKEQKEVFELSEEYEQILKTLMNFEGSISNKINLKKRLLEIKKRKNQLVQVT